MVDQSYIERRRLLKVNLNLSCEQQTALDIMMEKIMMSGAGVRPYFDRKSFIYKVGGYAGTGKTHLICQLKKEIEIYSRNTSVALCAFTGKASSVLKNKLQNEDLMRGRDYVGTIHGLIYRAKTKYDNVLKTYVVVGWRLIPYDEFLYDVIIIDEASMISEDIWNDLRKFNKPIIVIGDHGQLPPVSEKSFSLMKNPDFILKEIQRQEEDNPIIELSSFIRKNGYIPECVWSPGVFKIPWGHKKTTEIWNNISHDENIIVLCGFNSTRCGLNRNIRKKLEYKNNLPYPGERIVCLRNNHTIKLMNGQIGTLLWLMPEDKNLYRLTIEVDNEPEPYESIAHISTFDQVTYTIYTDDPKIKIAKKYAIKMGYELDYFDFGYCISVHKSQGSEWDKVVLFEQRTKHWDDEYYRRWLYTAVTRAKEKLMIISDYWG